MTRLAGYQPQYFPRLHYLARILDSDIFTISDYLQYVRKHAYAHADGSSSRGVSYQAHTPIKTREGVKLLDIPVKRAQAQTLREAQIDYSTDWAQKQLNILNQNYRKAPHFSTVFPEIESILRKPHSSLAQLTSETIIWALSKILEAPCPMEIREEGAVLELPSHLPFRLRKVVFLSESAIAPPDKSKGRDANDWIIEQCKVFGAGEYYFGGTSAAAYMDFERFKKAGIALKEQDWRSESYPQLHGEFIPNLSIIDLLMNGTPAQARDILHTKD